MHNIVRTQVHPHADAYVYTNMRMHMHPIVHTHMHANLYNEICIHMQPCMHVFGKQIDVPPEADQ